MEQWKQTALAAVRQAGAMALDFFNKEKKVSFKGEIDIVTDVDLACEDAIVSTIRQAFPSHNILTEETDYGDQASPCKWIIDPIDGTVNYYHGHPFFCVSLGLEYEGEIVLGAVYAPYFNELFFAQKGQGATLNNAPIVCSTETRLKHSLLCTGFPYDIATSMDNNLDYFSSIIKKVQAVRRDGSAALDLCYVACGRFDGFWELKLKPWDIAAASIIIQEAGGVISNFDDRSFSVYRDKIIAANPYIYQNILTIINEFVKGEG